MKKNTKFFLLIVMGLYAVISGVNHCAWADLYEVRILTSSHPTDNTKTTITATFDYTDTAQTGFYYTITTQTSHTITLNSISTQNYFSLPNDADSTRGDGPYEDNNYYLYIAAYKDVFMQETQVGPTTKYGPLTVDTQSPNFVTVDGPSTTEESLITLTINSNEDLNEICISETGYGNCAWEELEASNYHYTLSEYKDYKIYIQVKDVAGNMAQTNSPFMVTRITPPFETVTHTIPTLSQWGIIVFLSFLMIGGLYYIRRQSFCLSR